MDHPQGPSDENTFHCQGSTPTTTSPSNVVQQSITNTPHRNLRAQVPSRLKRTLTETDISTMLPPADQTPADQTSTAKRARIIVPVPSQPMPLRLPSENEMVGQPESASGGDCKGKAKLRRTSSYYPGRGDDHGCDHGPHYLPPPDTYGGDNDTDDHVETEEDWMGDELVAKLTQGSTSKFSEAVARERPSWKGLDSIAESILADQSTGPQTGDTPVSASASGRVVSVGTTPPLPESESKEATAGHELSVAAMLPAAISVNQTTTQESSGAPWPADTDLLFATGSSKIKLTLQHPLVRLVLQDAIDHMRAHLVLINAFPDPGAALAFARDSLMTAVEDRQPDTKILCQRFQDDIEYFTRVIPVPRCRISRIRSEVKERCNIICVPEIYAIGPQTEITRVIRGQLSNYNYTFPYPIIGIAPDGIPKRTRPYRNGRIISVIRDLYFTAIGGGSSLATRFEDHFPTHQAANGDIIQEVPMSMVALVATALYATLFEWRTGEQRTMEFSANTFLDVYLGHVNTLNHICENRAGMYHLMMADIFSLASTNANLSGNPIAELDLGALEN
ncbi:hypothetical protein EDB89DRAFT_2081025 [Lactarius sanguifluus]|nr:hypothetical protein EDB89DRAFT_2081025 [Lactarius sanguifluus]